MGWQHLGGIDVSATGGLKKKGVGEGGGNYGRLDLNEAFALHV